MSSAEPVARTPGGSETRRSRRPRPSCTRISRAETATRRRPSAVHHSSRGTGPGGVAPTSRGVSSSTILIRRPDENATTWPGEGASGRHAGGAGADPAGEALGAAVVPDRDPQVPAAPVGDPEAVR